jgi:HSP20 family protein
MNKELKLFSPVDRNISYFDNPLRSLFDWDAWLDELETDSKLMNPKVKIDDNDDGTCLTLDVPGFSKDDVSVEVKHGNYLIIKGSYNDKQVNEFGKRKTNKRFEKVYQLRETGVDSEKVKASLKDGVLSVFIPKKEEQLPKGKKIPIE